MASDSAIQRMLRNPRAMMRFQATAQVPGGTCPRSPMITLLESMGPRARAQLKHLVIDQHVGYQGSRTFHTAEQALRWLKPADEMFTSWPAESWRIKAFSRRLVLGDLVSINRTAHPADPAAPASVPGTGRVVTNASPDIPDADAQVVQLMADGLDADGREEGFEDDESKRRQMEASPRG